MHISRWDEYVTFWCKVYNVKQQAKRKLFRVQTCNDDKQQGRVHRLPDVTELSECFVDLVQQVSAEGRSFWWRHHYGAISLTLSLENLTLLDLRRTTAQCEHYFIVLGKRFSYLFVFPYPFLRFISSSFFVLIAFNLFRALNETLHVVVSLSAKVIQRLVSSQKTLAMHAQHGKYQQVAPTAMASRRLACLSHAPCCYCQDRQRRLTHWDVLTAIKT